MGTNSKPLVGHALIGRPCFAVSQFADSGPK